MPMASNEGSVFESVSEVELSRQERLKRLLDQWVLAPLTIILDDVRTLTGFAIVLLFALMGTVGVLIVPQPETGQGPMLMRPFQNIAHPLGTSKLGVDLLSQLVHATPAMWAMVLAGALFSTVVATILGTTSGYKRGITDTVITTVTDIAMTIPALPLIMVIAVVFEPRNPWLTGVVLAINAWAGLARAIRSEVISLREESYIEASRVVGMSTPTIIVKDILPNIMPYIAVNFVAAGRSVIFGSVALYFLGVLPISTTNWGVMLQFAYDYGALYQWNALHWLLVPIVAIILLTVGLLLIAQGAERIFNPRIRARHAKTIESDTQVE